MPKLNMSLSNKGGRGYTRGWRGAKYVKKQTNKVERRTAKRLLDDAPVKRMVSGWTW